MAVTTTDERGNTFHVATLDDGDYFGEIALLEDIPTTASVVTLVPSIFITLRREQLDRLVGSTPNSARRCARRSDRGSRRPTP